MIHPQIPQGNAPDGFSPWPFLKLLSASSPNFMDLIPFGVASADTAGGDGTVSAPPAICISNK